MQQVTGSTGTAPIQDGSVRGLIAGALTAILTLVADKTGALTDGDIATLTPVVVAVAFVLGGVFDKLVKPKITE